MRLLTCAALVSLVAAGPASAQQTNSELMGPIHKFIDNFNKGDLAAAAAAHASSADLTIVDEVPPYVWQGADAFKAWSGDLMGDAKKNGIADGSMKLNAPSRVEQNGDQGYVVVPAVYSFKQGGKAMREAGHMTFVLKKDSGGWLIHAWTWTGTRPTAAAAAAKH